MSARIHRSIQQDLRTGLSMEQLWGGDDVGLIACWEGGRALAEQQLDFAERARNGELPILHWRGGVEKPLKSGFKYGPLSYLATWQGLRGEDLDIDPSKEVEVVCSRTGTKVIYTPDYEKYRVP